VPVLLANASALRAGADDFETKIDGRPWRQSTFPYQAKCLSCLREAWSDLSPDAKGQAGAILQGTGCERLFS